MEYVLSVGTNIGDRKKNIQNAVDALNLIPNTKVSVVSDIYETEPVGYVKQDDFYNAVLKVQSDLEPNEMLGVCLGIEAGLGRERKIHWGPRIIDIDLIFAENVKIESQNLTLPHPRCFERRFVLEPCLDLFKDGIVYGTDIKPFIEKIDGQKIRKVK